MKEYQNVKMTHKFYKKGEHKKLIGHTILVTLPYVDSNSKMQEDFVVLTQKDLFIMATKKIDYFDSLDKEEK